MLELKLQQLTHEQHTVQLANRLSTSQGQVHIQGHPQGQRSQQLPVRPVSMQQTNIAPALAPQQQYPSSVPIATSAFPQHQQTQLATQLPYQPEVTGQPASIIVAQHFGSSLSSSGMSQHPMNSIPPTHTTGTLPITTYQGQGYQGHSARSAYQPATAVLTTDQLMTHSNQHPIMQNGYAPLAREPNMQAPAVSVSAAGQGQITVSPGHIPPESLTSSGMSEQMRKVREYQNHLLARHQQSKQVLEETKSEIQQRRSNLLQRYPDLDLSSLEGLGAKYLATQERADSSMQNSSAQPSMSASQGPPSSVASLLASLAKHPYYAATLGKPDTQSSIPQSVIPNATIATNGHAQINSFQAHPSIDSETNLRKNKMESIRKSLPFDADESLRYQEAYPGRNLDTSAYTDITETDTSSLTEKGSPALKPGPKPATRSSEWGTREVTRDREPDSTEESGMDTTTSGSFLSEKDDAAAIRQEELRVQLAKIQQQKEEIIRRHQVGCVNRLLDLEISVDSKKCVLISISNTNSAV